MASICHRHKTHYSLSVRDNSRQDSFLFITTGKHSQTCLCLSLSPHISLHLQQAFYVLYVRLIIYSCINADTSILTDYCYIFCYGFEEFRCIRRLICPFQHCLNCKHLVCKLCSPPAVTMGFLRT